MVKITKVYTKLGDQGETHLAGGLRVKKSSERIDVVGEIDELNSFLGWTIESLKAEKKLEALHQSCIRIQHELFNLGSQLVVMPEHRRENTPVVKEANIGVLEDELDEYNEQLPSLRSFILPGGGEIATRFHATRAVCRRAERSLVSLAELETIEPVTLSYLNRLSDWLFVVARFVSVAMGEEETLWVFE